MAVPDARHGRGERPLQSRASPVGGLAGLACSAARRSETTSATPRSRGRGGDFTPSEREAPGGAPQPAGLALTMKAIVMALAVAVAAITASAEQGEGAICGGCSGAQRKHLDGRLLGRARPARRCRAQRSGDCEAEGWPGAAAAPRGAAVRCQAGGSVWAAHSQGLKAAGEHPTLAPHAAPLPLEHGPSSSAARLRAGLPGRAACGRAWAVCPSSLVLRLRTGLMHRLPRSLPPHAPPALAP